MEKLAALAEAHDLIVIANEIHADLVYPGQEHIPFATVAPGLAARTITLNSASKSFNIAGLRCALMYFGDGALKQRFTQRLPARILGYPSGIGIDATVAAWDRGHSWLEGARHYLLERREQVITTVHTALPEVRVHTPRQPTSPGWILAICTYRPLRARIIWSMPKWHSARVKPLTPAQKPLHASTSPPQRRCCNRFWTQ